MSKIKNKKLGFTLVEIMVALSIFAIVALAVTNAFLTADRINKKAQAMKTIVDNLQFALNVISFNLKQGGSYHCFESSDLAVEATTYTGQNCKNGSTAIAFKSPNFDANAHTFIYKFTETGTHNAPASKGKIEYWESDSGMSDFSPITITNLDIDDLRFYVHNSDGTQQKAPRVFLSIRGVATLGKDAAPFQLQTVVSERF